MGTMANMLKRSNRTKSLSGAQIEIAEKAGAAADDLYWNVSLSSNSLSAEEMFDSMDADHNGFISDEEIRSWLRRSKLFGNDENTPKLLAQFMGTLDMDSDGHINRIEFALFLDAVRAILFPKKCLRDMEGEHKTRTEVFLGGSCNPTTWRKDTVIPLLEHSKVDYYNPQVDDWHPGLIALEDNAKQDALVLLFVIDGQTRAIASMVEVAELVTAGRNVVLVIEDVAEGAVIQGEQLSEGTRKDLNRCRAYLADVVMRRGHSGLAVVYKNVMRATCAAVALVEKLRINHSQHAVLDPVLQRVLSS